MVLSFSDFKYNPSAPAFTSQSDGKYSKELLVFAVLVHLSPGFELSPRDCLPDDATSSIYTCSILINF